MRLYDYCTYKNYLVSEFFEDGEWRIDFCRSFGQEVIAQWVDMRSILQEVTLSDSSDQVVHWPGEVE